MDWIECNKKGIVKEIKIDKNLVESLVNSSVKKMESQKLLPLSDITAASKISLAYDSLRELLEAIAITKNSKVYNHECYCILYCFLKEILHESALADEFNKFRKLRNSINYYGKDISKAETKIILKEMIEFTEKIRIMFFP